MDSPLIRTLRRTERWLRRAARPAYTHAIPLGLSCRVTYQLRTCLGSGASYPFDWWLSPLAGLTAYLADPDPRRIFRAEALVERWGGARIEAIESAELGLQLFHEFPRRPDLSGFAAIAPGWQAHLPQATERHERRLRRLLDLDRPGHRLLFVRHKAGPEANSWAEGEEIAALLRVLRQRFRRAETSLLLLNVQVRGPLPPGVESLYFNDPPGEPPEEWRGDGRSWREALATRGLRLKRGFRSGAGTTHPSPGEPD